MSVIKRFGSQNTSASLIIYIIRKIGIITQILIFFAVCCGILSCLLETKVPFDIGSIQSYRDIPGISAEEIAAIETLKSQRQNFSYGMLPSAEAFILQDGEYAGFTPYLCELFSKLFDIPFVPEMYDWQELKRRFDAYTIDFTVDINATLDLEQHYFKTSPIDKHKLSVFVKDGGLEIMSEYDLRGLKIGFYAGSSSEQITRNSFPRVDFRSVAVNTADEIAEKLESGEIDAFIFDTDDVFTFYEYAHVTEAKDFPYVYVPAAISTANPELESVISVITKYLLAGGINEVTRLYEIGEREYAEYVFRYSLNDEEREYIAALKANGEKVPVGFTNNRYPVAFYDEKSKEYQGIAKDVLDEISILTGIEFNIAHDTSARWVELEGMLKTGEIKLISQLIPNDARREYAIWPGTHYFAARYALLSNLDFPYLSLNQVPYAAVGVVAGTAEEPIYRAWFPNSEYKTFITSDEALTALEKGEIDLFFSLDYALLYETNYRENAGQKVNILFDTPVEKVPFGLNKNEVILCSIISKAQRIINTERFVRNWTSRVFDLSKQMAEQKARIYAVFTVILSIMLLTLFSIFMRSLRLAQKVKKQTQATIDALHNAALREQEANQLKSRFVAMMSHEIRTPMNAILGITEIQLQNESLSTDTEEALSRIYDSGNLLLYIINDILDLSKIEAGKLEILPVKYDLPSLVNDVVQLNRLRYDSKPIELYLEIDENTPLNMFGDELRIKQILNNILSNAFKYTDAGTIKLSVYSETLRLPDGQADNDEDAVTMIFRVNDTGQGMTEEQISKLFDEYARFNLDSNRTTVGTGLGMSITKQLLDLMDGEIYITSKKGIGSEFTVRLPQKRIDSFVCGKDIAEKLRNFSFKSTLISKKNQMLREYMPYGSVLVVDDVETNIYVTKGMLLPYGLKVDTASSGFDAIEKVKAGNVYDIIFMDHMMPRMDGIEATKIIRSMGYKHNIIALTANALVGQAEVFLENSFNGYISKPIDSRELNQILNEFIRNKKPPEVVKAARREQRAKNNEQAYIRSEAMNNETEKETEKMANRLEMEKFFIIDAESAVAALEGLFDGREGSLPKIGETEINSYEITVHGMKSALANIGEKDLSAVALRLEKAAIDKNLAVIEEETPAFIDALKKLIVRFNAEIEAGKNKKISLTNEVCPISGEDAVFLREKLSEIKTACHAFDSNAARIALDDIKQKTWPQQIDDVLDEINVHLLHSAFKKAAAAAEAATEAGT